MVFTAFRKGPIYQRQPDREDFLSHFATYPQAFGRLCSLADFGRVVNEENCRRHYEQSSVPRLQAIGVVCCCDPRDQVHVGKRNFRVVSGRTCLPKPVGHDKIKYAAFVACQSNPVTYKDFYVCKSRFADHGITF